MASDRAEAGAVASFGDAGVPAGDAALSRAADTLRAAELHMLQSPTQTKSKNVLFLLLHCDNKMTKSRKDSVNNMSR